MVGLFLFFIFFLSASLSHLLDLSQWFLFFLAVIWWWIRQWWVQMVTGGSVMVASDGRPVGSFRWLGRLLFMLMSMQYKCRPFLLISQKISASLQQSSTIGPSITSPHPEGPEPSCWPEATANTLWVWTCLLLGQSASSSTPQKYPSVLLSGWTCLLLLMMILSCRNSFCCQFSSLSLGTSQVICWVTINSIFFFFFFVLPLILTVQSHQVKKTEVEVLLLGFKLSNCTLFTTTSSTILTTKASTKFFFF